MLSPAMLVPPPLALAHCKDATWLAWLLQYITGIWCLHGGGEIAGCPTGRNILGIQIRSNWSHLDFTTYYRLLILFLPIIKSSRLQFWWGFPMEYDNPQWTDRIVSYNLKPLSPKRIRSNHQPTPGLSSAKFTMRRKCFAPAMRWTYWTPKLHLVPCNSDETVL